MGHLFDLRMIFLAKHAQHIELIHFPIGLFLMSVVFDVIGWLKKSGPLRIAAYINLVAASVMSVAAVATGILAWQLIYDGGTPKGVLLLHMIGAGSTMVLLWALTIIRRRNRPDAPLPGIYVVGAIIASMLIMLTAHLGGILSGTVQLAE